MSDTATPRIVGTSVPRKEGREKVTGQAKYIDDQQRPGMWYGATVRSNVPRAKILGIHFSPEVDWNQFAIVTAKDIPGSNHIQLIFSDWLCLADTQTNHNDEAIALIAHPDKHILQSALSKITVEYETLPAVLSIEDSERGETIVWGKDNILKSYLLEKGSVDGIWAEAAWIVEGEYSTGAQEHLYIEPNGVIAEYDKEKGVTVWGSMQCPFYVQKAVDSVFDLPPEKVRIVHVETGGAFGGKEDYPSILAAHAALLAYKSGHPVKMVYDRAEDMAATTKRHPSRTRHKTALDKDGKLLAMEIEFVTDGGAYCTLSSTVLSRGTIHASGPYLCPNVRIRSRAMATNTVPYGAFRGFGAPQSLFAIERHMDCIAATIKMDPIELRRKNFLHQGSLTATEQKLHEDPGLDGLLDQALKVSDFYTKKKSFAADKLIGNKRRGIGIATFMHGAGFTGSGERNLNSEAGIDFSADGHFRILVSNTEFGQGTNTILCQIGAEALNCEYSDVIVAQPDTSIVPNSGPTVASRTSMIVGRLVERAGHQLRKQLEDAGELKHGASREQLLAACKKWRAEHGELKSYVHYEAPPNIFWDDETYHGEAYSTFGWAVYVAEVEVDMVTYTAEVKNFYAVQDIGRVLHPILAGGQVEGGVLQGIGFALCEKVEWRNGHMANNQMTNYIIPTSEDVPPIHVHFRETPFQHGGYGAKGIGELPMDGPAPAILNAIQDATGVAFYGVPLLPEDVMARLAALQDQREEEAVAG